MGRMLWKRNKPRLLAVLLAVCLLAACVPAAFAAEGSCGDGLSWSLSGGNLTITGAGAMADYAQGSAPWLNCGEEILTVSLPEGLTRVGDWAFYNCESLTAVNLPATVSHIGEGSFYGCRGLTMLSLNNGLTAIGESAFSQCESLTDLRLPQSLVTIDHHAFYLCKGLTYVTIPSGVVSIGSGVFAYCDSLLRVDVEAAVTMPGWSFYGCDRLQTVTVQGSSVNPESLKVVTTPSGTVTQTPDPTPEATDPPKSGQATSLEQTVTDNGEIRTDTTTVKQTDNSTIINNTQTTITETSGTTGGTAGDTTITATVQNPEGWQEVIKQVESALPRAEEVTATVYTPQTDTVEKEVLQELSGKKVSLTVQTQSGSRFTVDCTKLPEKVKKDLVLTYTLTPAENVPEELAGYTVYELSFHQSADILTEIVMALPGDHALQTATLFQQNKKELESLQNVLVDDSGKAHWYVSNVDEKTQYYIGIDVPTGTADSPIIPAELAGVYKVANVYDGVEYKVTGRSSSWNMGLGQVMAILAAVMVGAIAIIGGVMYTMNKRRLKNGYVPQWEDEE